MKYLIRFNEELKPSTYRSAARKISKFGGNVNLGRSEDLKNWANKVEYDEDLISWEKAKEEYSKFGKFKLTITSDKGTFRGDFFLALIFDNINNTENYEDMQEDGDFSSHFFFSVGIIPADKTVLDKCIEIMPEPDFGVSSGVWI